MDTVLRAVTLKEAQEASERLKIGNGGPLRTPLIKATFSPPEGPEIWLKLENLQSIGSFKIRGAGNAIKLYDEAILREKGVVTPSAGNMGQGVAYCAKQMGITCKVVVPKNAPATKVEAVERLGAEVVSASRTSEDRVAQVAGAGTACAGTACAGTM